MNEMTDIHFPPYAFGNFPIFDHFKTTKQRISTVSVIHCGGAGRINLRYQRHTQLSLCQMNLSSRQSGDLFLFYPTCQQGATLWTSSLGRHSSSGKLSGHPDKIVITPLIQGLHVVSYVGRQLGQLLLGHIHAMPRMSDSELASLATWTKGPGAPRSLWSIFFLRKAAKQTKLGIWSQFRCSHAVFQPVLLKLFKKKGRQQKAEVRHWAHRVVRLELRALVLSSFPSFSDSFLPLLDTPRGFQAVSEYNSCPAVLPTLPCLVKFEL